MPATQGEKKLRMHKVLGRPWHKESGLVFKSKEEKVVIGRLEGEDFIDLDDDTIDLASNWQFKLDPSLVTEEDDANDSESEEEVQAQSNKTDASVSQRLEPAEEEPVEEEEEPAEEEPVEEEPEDSVPLKTAPETPTPVNENLVDMQPSEDTSALKFDLTSLVDQVFASLTASQRSCSELSNKNDELVQTQAEMQKRLEKAEKRCRVLTKALAEME